MSTDTTPEPLPPVRKRPEPIWDNGMHYDGAINWRGFEKVSIREIKRLLIAPENATPQERAAWDVETKQIVTNVWLTAQLKHYDLTRGSSGGSRPEMIETMIGRHGPIQSNDRSRYYPSKSHPGGIRKMADLAADWDNRCNRFWQSLKNDPRHAEFESLVTMKEKLDFAPNLFFDTFFLDRRTTTDILSFRDIDFAAVTAAAKKVPTLHVKTHGTGKNKTIWFGWDLAKIIKAMESKNGRATKAVQRLMANKAKVDARLEPHRDYVASLASMTDKERRVHEYTLSPEGSYIIEGSGLNWKDDIYTPETMWMQIAESRHTPGVFEAVVDVGLAFRGLMLISTTDETVKKYSTLLDTVDYFAPPKPKVREIFYRSMDVDRQLLIADDDDYPDRWEDSYDMPSEADFGTQQEAYLQGYMMGLKRKRRDDISSGFPWDDDRVWLKRHCPDRAARAAATEPTPSRPTKYDMRCRGTMRIPEWSEQFLHDEMAYQTFGTIEFTDDTLSEFTLRFALAPHFAGVNSVDDQATIKGYRVSHNRDRGYLAEKCSAAWGSLRDEMEGVMAEQYDFWRIKDNKWGRSAAERRDEYRDAHGMGPLPNLLGEESDEELGLVPTLPKEEPDDD